MPSILKGAFVYCETSKDRVEWIRCQKVYKYHHSTTTLQYHLKNAHPFANQSSIDSTSSVEKALTKTTRFACSKGESSTSAYSTSESADNLLFQTTLDQCTGLTKISTLKSTNMTNALTLWIAKDSRPLSIVNDKGLTNLLRVATGNSQYELPTRQTISQRVDKLYIDAKLVVANYIESAPYIAITCDYWSSVANQSYLGVTGHFVNPETMELKNYVLAVDYSAERHTA